MSRNAILGIMFALAALCFAAGTVNHILNTGEGIVSSSLLSLGCMAMAIACYKKK